MYSIAFVKKNLYTRDEEVGRVVVQNLYSPGETGELLGYKVKGTIYGEGTEFETAEMAKQFAKEFESLLSRYPNTCVVTTEVYKV